MNNANKNSAEVVPRRHSITDALERCALKARVIANNQRRMLEICNTTTRPAAQEDGATYTSPSGETP